MADIGEPDRGKGYAIGRAGSREERNMWYMFESDSDDNGTPDGKAVVC